MQKTKEKSSPAQTETIHDDSLSGTRSNTPDNSIDTIISQNKDFVNIPQELKNLK